MQRAYISKLMELASEDKNILHVLSDSGTAYDEMFKRNFPKQFLNFGISEEHKVAAAAGLATCEKIPFLYTSGAFLAYRAFEFIRNDVCYQKLNVKIVGMGSGLSWSSLGPSHHTTEDIGVLRTIPNLRIYSPATPLQVSACVEAAYEHEGPVYIRIGMNNEKEYFGELDSTDFTNHNILKEEGPLTVFTTGTILEEVYEAVSALEKEGMNIRLINLACIKPFDKNIISKEIEHAKMFLAIEEHNIYGGIGSIITEILAEDGIGIPLKRIGLEDAFAIGYGNLAAVRRTNGLDRDSLKERIKKIYEQIYI